MSNRRPNIVLLMSDQHRFDAVGCYGNPQLHTPEMDAMAANGVVFETCYVQNPICSPSRASFATGQYVRNHGLWANGVALDARAKTLSTSLAESGYDCGMAGKQHLAPCADGDEVRRDDGYRTYRWSHDPIHQSRRNSYHVWLREHHPEIYQREITSRAGQPAEAGNVAKGATGIDTVPVEAHYSSWVADEAIDFIHDTAGRDSDQPFYFMANFFDPHHPFGAPKPFRDLYDADTLTGPYGDRAELDSKPEVQREYSAKSYGGHAPGFEEYTDAELREARASYYAMVSLIDAQIGRIKDALRSAGQLENTIIIYTSDHGEMLGDHAIMLKGPMLYESGVRVPLIMEWPEGLPSGRRVSEIVQNIDLTSTLLDLAQTQGSLADQGSSLLGLARGEEDDWRDWALCEYRDSGHSSVPPTHTTMLRHRDHKLVVWHGAPATDRRRDGELYDLANDPYELTNLYHHSEHRDLREELKDSLLDVLDATELRTQPRLAAW